MIESPVCVAPTGDVCGEGPVWHAARQAVYWTDINRFLIHRLNLADSTVRTWLFDEPVTSLSLTDRDDVLIVVLGSRVILWEPATDLRHDPLFRLDGWPAVRLNDARCDPRGSLWLGSMRNNVNAGWLLQPCRRTGWHSHSRGPGRHGHALAKRRRNFQHSCVESRSPPLLFRRHTRERHLGLRLRLIHRRNFE